MNVDGIYQALDAALPHVEGNSCGTCNLCCTAEGLSVQHVLEVEFAGLEQHLGKEAVDRFRAYTERRRNETGQMVHAICPFYDLTASGCGIYPFRPFSCRLFGHFRLQGTLFPEPCVFRGREKEVPQGRYFQDIPLADRLRDLDRRHISAQRPDPSTMRQAPASISKELLAQARMGMNPDDPLDMAALAHMEGRLQDALRLFGEGLDRNPESAWGFFQVGTLLDEIQMRDEAARAFRRATALEPDNARYHVHLGFNRMESGDAQAAREAFATAVRLEPDDAVSHGFLGLLWWMDGNAIEARPNLERAVALDPANVYFHLRLAEVLWALGKNDEAEPHLGIAAAHPHTAPHVEAMRRLGPPHS